MLQIFNFINQTFQRIFKNFISRIACQKEHGADITIKIAMFTLEMHSCTFNKLKDNFVTLCSVYLVEQWSTIVMAMHSLLFQESE